MCSRRLWNDYVICCIKCFGMEIKISLKCTIELFTWELRCLGDAQSQSKVLRSKQLSKSLVLSSSTLQSGGSKGEISDQ